MYTALYRQWRPDTFKDVVGQDTIIRTLKNQLSSGHIAHAYLFCGSRGTGKTSTAKIFARAINCMTPTEYGPCGECEVCINLSSESNMDILEIDAASNNGVDEIRDLRDKVRFPPTVGKYKVYIIDEVHMLSIGAFNALLKTLEEPPSHVVFILATTEPHKLPATILSRCQRFDFKRISQKVIVSRMRTICNSMNISIEEEGLHTIARWAEGGMRDALSLLDQIISFSGGQITNDDILNILGTADQSFLFQAVDDILTGNLQGILHKIGRLLDSGKALNIFTRSLIQHMRNLLIVKACDQPEDLLDVSESSLEQLKVQAAEAGEARLIRSLEILSPLETEMRYNPQPRVLLELAVVKLCRPEQEVSLEALQDRVEALEKQLKNGAAVISKKSTVVKEQYEAAYEVDTGQSYCPAMNNPVYSTTDDSSMPPVPPETEDNYFPEDSQSFSPGLAKKKTAVNKNQTDLKAGKADGQTSKADGQTFPRKIAESNSGMIEVERKSKNERSVENRKTSEAAAAVSTASADDSISKDSVEVWSAVLNTISKERPLIHAALKDVKPHMDNNSVMNLVFPSDGFQISIIEQMDNRTFIEEIVKKTAGQEVRIKCLLEGQTEEPPDRDENYAVKKAIEVFGEDQVEVVDEE